MSTPEDPGRQREELREQRLAAEASDAEAEARRKRRVQLISLAAFGAAILVAALIAISQSGGGSSDDSSGAGGTTDVSGIPQDNTVLGDAKAPVTIVEFGDLQCPICRAFSKQVAPGLIDKFVRPGEAKYDFKLWNIIGPQSPTAAAAAYAAGEQDRYWQFIDTFYDQQQAENSGYIDDAFLEGIAKDAGVPDLEKWKADSAVSKWQATFDQTDAQASAMNFTGTPSVYVEGPNGRKVFGGNTVPSASEIESAIQSVQ